MPIRHYLLREDCFYKIRQNTVHDRNNKFGFQHRGVSMPSLLCVSWTLRGILIVFVSSNLHHLYMPEVLITAFDSPPTAESCQHTLPGRETPRRILVIWRARSRVGKGISAQASHRTVRDSLPSYGSCYPIMILFPVANDKTD